MEKRQKWTDTKTWDAFIKKSENFRGSEFSILPYTQNGKLGNLGKCCFTLNFDSSCNLRCKNNKKLTETKT